MDLRHERFVAEYLIDGIASRAAERAGFASASGLMANPEIRATIKSARTRMMARMEITRERVLLELARIAFADTTHVVRVVDGRVVIDDTDLCPETVTAAIAELRETKDGPAVKFHSKTQALALLCEHFGITKPDVVITPGTGSVTLSFVPAVTAAPVTETRP